MKKFFILLLLLFPISVHADVNDVNKLLAKSWEHNYYEKAIVDSGVVKVDGEKRKYTDFIATLENPNINKKDGKIIITSPYQSKRIVVHKNNIKGYGEIDRASCAMMTVLYFKTEEDTKTAFEKIIRKDNTAYVDKIIRAETIAGDRYYSEGTALKFDKAEKYNKFTNKVTVAVMDSGLTPKNKIFKGVKISPYSKNIINNNSNYADGDGHGTAVSSIIVDCTPNNVELMPVKVLDDQGYGSYLSITLGLYQAANNGADVVNMSFASIINIDEMDRIIQWAYSRDVVMVAAAGNISVEYMMYPARNPFVIGVGSHNPKTKKISYFSSYGEGLDFSAPGEDICVAWNDGGLYSGDGTSFSCPFISSAAAYIKLVNPKATNKEVYNLLKSKTKDLGQKGYDIKYGWGVPKVNYIINDMYRQQLKKLPIVKRKVKLGKLKKNFYVKYKKNRAKIYRKKDKKLFITRKVK